MSFCLSTPNQDTHITLDTLTPFTSLERISSPLDTYTINWQDHKAITGRMERSTIRSQGAAKIA
jgi:hypothetical protein